ncbi:hypothetical protein SAMN02927900_04741 [Rhizobium mongolense subsp. loessense]|uniref:Uncharacterized protein n=1 Tax=Rhizobium mongolense subsp. loessense TaxID=158890 RepID=A0A1G4T6R6_9HYPH|nr:hypothetical protein [Rhizobium mongolense]SCW76956.1 hypothetical protein SAMN02927900_04741 [Rhizobium mongolense subsp. loessense]
MARKPRKYHTLVIRINGRWSPEFGAYEREDVRAEYAGYLESGEAKRKDLKVITTGDTQAEIMAAVAKLNGEGA